jgi:hypothetical protein
MQAADFNPILGVEHFPQNLKSLREKDAWEAIRYGRW